MNAKTLSLTILGLALSAGLAAAQTSSGGSTSGGTEGQQTSGQTPAAQTIQVPAAQPPAVANAAPAVAAPAAPAPAAPKADEAKQAPKNDEAVHEAVPAEAGAPAKTKTEDATAAETPAEKPKPAEKPLNPDAAKYAVLADAFQKAHDDFLTWLRGASDTLDLSQSKIDGLKKQIEANSDQMTKLQLDQSADSDKQARELKTQNNALWNQLRAEQRRRQDLVRAFGRAVDEKARALNKGVLDALATVK